MTSLPLQAFTTDGKSRCQALTKSGTQCTRSAEPGSLYCWQHKDYIPGMTSKQFKALSIPEGYDYPITQIKTSQPQMLQSQVSTPTSQKLLTQASPKYSNKLTHQQQLQNYVNFMNEYVSASSGRNFGLEYNFAFFSNHDEATYEAQDFFIYDYKDNERILNQLNQELGEDNAYVIDENGASTFVVVSVGSSSTQLYFVRAGLLNSTPDIIAYEYPFGTNNFKQDAFLKMMQDLIDIGRNILFINSIGFGVTTGVKFANLENLDSVNNQGSASDLIVKIYDYLVDYNTSGLEAVVANQTFGGNYKFKNKWTNAIAQDNPKPEHSFFVDYGGGKVSISHVFNGQMDEKSLANFKYDQDPIYKYYQDGNTDINSQLWKNKDTITDSISSYITSNGLIQVSYPVLVRQTGKLREYYYE